MPLALRIQLQIGLVIAIVIVAGTFLSYRYSISTLQLETLAALRESTASRAAFESRPFLDAEVNTNALKTEYLRRLAEAGAADPKAGFDARFVQSADGLIRVRPGLDDHKRLPSIYIQIGRAHV